MPRNLISESFINTERVSFDPTDNRTFEIETRELLQGEGALMLAILDNAVEYFQKYALAQNGMGSSYSKKRRTGFWENIAISFSRLSLSARLWSYTRITSVKD